MQVLSVRLARVLKVLDEKLARLGLFSASKVNRVALVKSVMFLSAF